MTTSFTLNSSSFEAGDYIPKEYSYKSDNISPALSWDKSSLPKGTESLALIVNDPDAPKGLWTHWLVKDIPVTTTSISEGSVPGKEVKNSFGITGYGGPAPPSGVHRYFFKLYAMPYKNMKATTLDAFYKEVKDHALGEAEIMGKYAAKK